MQESDNPKLYRLRHSLAHVLGQAVRQKYPNVQLGFGPPIENGFYYDFDFGAQPFQEQDLKEIEKFMRKIIGQGQTFARIDCDYDQALQHVANGEPYKQENIKNLYDCGKFGPT